MDFYNRINLIIGNIVQDVCTEESCPTMSGGKRFVSFNLHMFMAFITFRVAILM